MIHTKSLIRRLDCVPWLLAVCLLALDRDGSGSGSGSGWSAYCSSLDSDGNNTNDGAV